MFVHGFRAKARRQIRRRRRPLAAILAALAVAVGLASLNRPAVSATTEASDGTAVAITELRAHEVAVPIALASADVARALNVGDVIDIVGVTADEQAAAVAVAPGARVIEVPTSGGFGSASSSVVVVAVPERNALDVSAASANGGLTVLIRERVPR